MRSKTRLKTIAVLVSGVLGAAVLAPEMAFAQLSTATIKGQITLSGAPAKAATQVVARNKDSGVSYKATTRADGSYVLTGLAPGSYEISVSGSGKTETVTVHVGETASLDLAIASGADKVVVVGAAQRAEVRTSEVGTSVSRAQIENLPQVTRNFLSFADLAPGVRFNVDPSGNVKVQSGSQNQDNINVFIDGVGQKNYILRGGLSGMDSTRGNPFPQSAIGEYKIVSQNYKAEFDQVSSAAITAVTKSGTNELHGDVFWDHTRTNWTSIDPFQEKAKAAGVDRPKASQDQYGFTLGGPIKKDAMHFFLAYEGKDIAEPRQVVAQRTDLLPNAGIVPSLLAQQGSTTAKFNENLLLAKLDAQIAEDQRLELSARIRREKDLVPEDKKLSVPGNDLNRANDETRVDLKHELTRGNYLNEARIGYEEFSWNPHSSASTPYVKYRVSPSNNKDNAFDVLFTGGSPNAQNRAQKGVLLQDDLTYTGMAGHTMKGGAKLKDMTFDLSGTARGVDILESLINNTTGIATVVKTDPAIPPAGVKFKDRMFGVYLQDDWQVNKQLEVNLGIRWDYEDNALNDSYVTPADRVAALLSLEPRDANGFSARGWPVVPGTDFPVAAGQTYAQSLAKGGININDYISTGSSRKAFTGAFQPRVGFSYDVKGDKASVVFGGYGRAYDRTMANHALDEMQKNAQPGGEIWLIKNDHKMPYTDQLSFGLRQAVSMWNTEVGYSYSHSHNQFNWYGGNRDPLGGYAHQSFIDPLWNGPTGYGTLILGDFVSQAKTQTVYLKADKPYTKTSGWGLSATYTYSDGQTTNKEWTNDIFNWTYGKSGVGWNPSTDVEKHRIVVAGLTDSLIPFGIMLSGKVTVGSGLPYRVTDCSTGWDKCVSQKGDGGSFKQVDIGVSKDVALPYGKVVVRADVINLFNATNLGYYDSWGGGPGNPKNYLGGDNSNLGVAGGMAGPMRTFKLSVRYAF